MAEQQQPEFVTLGDAALRLGVPAWKLDRAARAGLFPCVMVSCWRAVRLADLEAIRAKLAEKSGRRARAATA